MASIDLSAVTLSFGATRAVDGVTLSVPSGASLSLLCPSGCDKSTLLRLIAGLERPDAGRIALNGSVVVEGRHLVEAGQCKLDMVFRSYALWPHMTVAGNVAFGLEMQRTPYHTAEGDPGGSCGGRAHRRCLAAADGMADRAALVPSGGGRRCGSGLRRRDRQFWGAGAFGHSGAVSDEPDLSAAERLGPSVMGQVAVLALLLVAMAVAALALRAVLMRGWAVPIGRGAPFVPFRPRARGLVEIAVLAFMTAFNELTLSRSCGPRGTRRWA